MRNARQIRLTYFAVSSLVACALSLTQPVWMLRLTGAGYGLREVSLVSAVGSLAVLALEVPTGVVADRYGRRLSVLLCFGLSALGHLVWGLTDSLPLLLAGLLVNSAGAALFSGAFDAWVVDALAAAGQPGSATELFGRSAGISRTCAVLVGFLSGAVLTRFGLRLPYLAAACLWLLLLAVGWSLVAEPPVVRSASRSVLAEVRAMAASVTDIVRRARQNPALGLLLLAPIPFYLGGAAVVNQWQVRFTDLSGGQAGITGYVWAAMLAVGAAVSFAMPRLVRAAGSQQRFLAAAAAVNALAIGGMALSGSLWWAVPLMCAHVAATTSTNTALAAAISDRVGPEVRATALSVSSMSTNLADSAGALLFGAASAAASVRFSWLAAGGVVMLSAVAAAAPRPRPDYIPSLPSSADR